MKTLFIIRGPSGAGKGHYIQNHIVKNSSFDQVTICSADKFFMKTRMEGNTEVGFRDVPYYDFDVGKLPEAHSFCMSEVLNALMVGHECIVVDNTHTRRWEYQNYELAARLVGYQVHIIEIVPETLEQIRVCAERNIHRVPAGVVASQSMRFQHDRQAVVIRGTMENDAS